MLKVMFDNKAKKKKIKINEFDKRNKSIQCMYLKSNESLKLFRISLPRLCIIC